MEKIGNGINGIVRSNINGTDYIFWKDAEIVKPYIRKYLNKIFPNKKVIREFNRIDLSVPEENLPVEVQATPLDNRVDTIKYSRFENDIRKQIEQNIVNYNRCWFFFDSALLKNMKNANRQISINMDWFRKYIKDGKLKVFTISHDGTIDELEYKDFDFLSKISQTCSVAYETDDMILNRNKMKIFANVVNGYDFTQEEIDEFDDTWKRERNNREKFNQFVARQKNNRMKLYRNILYALGDLSEMNNMLDINVDNVVASRKHFLSVLGVFESVGMGSGSITKFIDRFDVCKYFPGYLRNKDIWNKLKGHNLNNRQFENVVIGKTDVIKGIEYYWGI